MLIGDSLDIAEDELNVIYVCTWDDYPCELKSYEVGIDEKYWIHGNSHDHFRRDCIEAGYRLTRLYPVYHQGWEMDEWAAEGTKDGKKWHITTNHGKLQVERKKSISEHISEWVKFWK
jgi:hypothetical protein